MHWYTFFVFFSQNFCWWNHAKSIQFQHFPTICVGEIMLNPQVAGEIHSKNMVNSHIFCAPLLRLNVERYDHPTLLAGRLETTSLKLHLWSVYHQKPHLHTFTLWKLKYI
jgi:hypothetical protein